MASPLRSAGESGSNSQRMSLLCPMITSRTLLKSCATDLRKCTKFLDVTLGYWHSKVVEIMWMSCPYVSESSYSLSQQQFYFQSVTSLQNGLRIALSLVRLLPDGALSRGDFPSLAQPFSVCAPIGWSENPKRRTASSSGGYSLPGPASRLTAQGRSYRWLLTVSSFDLGRPMRTKTETKRESPAGLLVVDSGNRPLYANVEAIRVLAYPEDPEKIKSSGNYLAEKIRSVALNGESTTRLTTAWDFASGRRRYRCRSFVLESSSKNPAAQTVGILIERVPQAAFLVSAMGDEFHLTCREKEAVRLLSEGLTSKEIAQRMQISLNTVKAYLRLTMVKLGVSSRSGVLGKLLRH